MTSFDAIAAPGGLLGREDFADARGPSSSQRQLSGKEQLCLNDVRGRKPDGLITAKLAESGMAGF